MIAAISGWWSGLSIRERWLVGVAAGLAAIVIGWFLIALPLQSALSSARDAHGIAVDRHAAILARVEALNALEARGAAPATGTANGAAFDLAITQAAAEKGFALTRTDPQGGNAVVIAIANARAPALLGWIGELEATGVTAADLSLRPNADGTVAMTATLRRAQ